MATPPILLAAAVQWSPGADPASNRDAVARLVAEAAARGARLVVLPEYSQAFDADMAALAPTIAEPLDGPFVVTLQEAAAAAGAVVLAGMVERLEPGDDGEPRVANTVVAVDGEQVLAAYRKVHLYDAFGMRESDWLTPGNPAQRPVIDVDGHSVGIQTCYDVRFPEQSRLLVDAGADVLAIPAEWVRGPLKEHHWVTLVTARAIESTVHAIAADHAPPVGAGRSLIVDPMGVALAQLGEADGIAIAPIDAARTAAVRERNPSLANRRHPVHRDPGKVMRLGMTDAMRRPEPGWIREACRRALDRPWPTTNAEIDAWLAAIGLRVQVSIEELRASTTDPIVLPLSVRFDDGSRVRCSCSDEGLVGIGWSLWRDLDDATLIDHAAGVVDTITAVIGMPIESNRDAFGGEAIFWRSAGLRVDLYRFAERTDEFSVPSGLQLHLDRDPHPLAG